MHFLAGWLALAAASLNLLRAKGSGSHKAFGYVFVLGMGLVGLDAAVAVLQRSRYDLYAASAALGFAATVWALLPFIDRRPGWVERHARRMQAAVALCAAAGNALLPSLGQPGVAASAAMTAAIVVVGIGLARLQRAEIERVAAETA